MSNSHSYIHNFPSNAATRSKPKEPPNLKASSLMKELMIGETVTIPMGGDSPAVQYITERIIGSGSFGVVFLAREISGGRVVAIKKVLQDRRYKNRELQIMRVRQTMPMIYVRLFAYQLLRSLSYTHCLGICHRDIKPQNLLVNPENGRLALCDFGSAKRLVKGEPNVSYICSRYYRAPELIFGATQYSTAIDVWSAGCVIAELLLGQPSFPGDSGIDQLIEIIKALGTPSREQILSMNRAYGDLKLPIVKPQPWVKIFRAHTPPDAIDLVARLLRFSPERRLLAIEACAHPFFDPLRSYRCRLPNGQEMPKFLFQFRSEELQGLSQEMINKLVYYEPESAEEEEIEEELGE